MALAAIQTRAYGRLFRSRLEARWAVFFTTLGIRWEYEPEGFDLDGDFYLPDFRVWTPQGEPIWYEIKPFSRTEDPKHQRFQEALNDGDQSVRTSLLSGSPLDCIHNSSICPRCGTIYPHHLSTEEVFDESVISISCFACDMETPSGGGHPWRSDGFLGSVWTHDKGWIETPAWCHSRLRQIVNNAVTAAMSARFEHGESPE